MCVVVLGKTSSQMPTIDITEAQFEELIPKAGTALPASSLDDLISQVSALDMDEIRQEIAADAPRLSTL